MSAREQVIEILFKNDTQKTLDVKFFPGEAAVNNSEAMWDEFLSILTQERNGTATITNVWPDNTPKRGIEQITQPL